ncbi:CBF-domain-containing protein [Exidia glandulosa HHB12029]|uniref:CBF-domain-containing protein n=1 Tax=Exidia glandulosa HHB12029 TaxID=1314781 RepID=A0A165ZK52_EXIGL|nr:CBF-domain-containing protein [Exidia glandulosa HHB12029]
MRARLRAGRSRFSPPALATPTYFFNIRTDTPSLKQKGKTQKVDASAETSTKPSGSKPKKNAPSVLKDEAAPASSSKADVKIDIKPVPSSSKGFIVQPTSHWYEAVPALGPSTKQLSQDQITALSTRANSLLAQDVARYEETQNKTNASDAGFIQRVLSSGTLSDRLSALTLLAQASPLHNQSTLESLRGLARKKSRDGSLKAVRAIVDWWVGGGAPERKLKYFRDQPLGNPEATDAHLVVWAFEDWLKKYFFGVLQILEALSMDPLSYVRIQACTFIFQLLRDRPEQEQNLLRLLVNKLGDADRPVASRVSYHLMQLVQAHPQMKAIVIGEVEASVFGGKERRDQARYYAVITFNQMVLSTKESAVANRLMDLYFKLFQEILGDTGAEKDEKAKEDGEGEERPKKRRKQDRPKMKGKGKKAKDDDDDFGTLEESDSKMISALLTGINRAVPFASLTESSFTKHVDTLFRITHEATFNISIQALMLIDHIVSSLAALPTTADLANRFYRSLYAAILDPRLPSSGKHALFLTLLAKAMRRDEEGARRAAFIRRLVGSLAMHGPGFACAALVMLGRLSSKRPEVRELLSGTGTMAKKEDGQKYDPGKREPLYAHAEGTGLWELIPLLSHYHPSVALHAQQLRDGERLTGAPDVGLYSLANFLDRFVLKNAKKVNPTAQRGASAMQPEGHAHEAEIDEEKLRGMDEDDVDPEQIFYHRFVKLKSERERKMGRRKKKRADEDEDGDDEDGDEEAGEEMSGSEQEDEGGEDEQSELDEDEVWAAMKGSAPNLDDDVDLDDDSDLDMPSEDDDDADAGESAASPDDDAEEGVDGSDAASDEDSDDEGLADLMEDDEDVMGDDELIDFPSDAESGGGEDDEWGGVENGDGGTGTKRKRGSESESKKRKKRLRELPTFATYEDYQRMIEDGPEDNI